MSEEHDSNPNIVDIQIEDLDDFLNTIQSQNNASNVNNDEVNSLINLIFKEDENSETSTSVQLQKEKSSDSWNVVNATKQEAFKAKYQVGNKLANTGSKQPQKQNRRRRTRNNPNTELGKVNSTNVKQEVTEPSQIKNIEANNSYLVNREEECEQFFNTMNIKQECNESLNILDIQSGETFPNMPPNINTPQQFPSYEYVQPQHINQLGVSIPPQPMIPATPNIPLSNEPRLAHNVLRDYNPYVYRYQSQTQDGNSSDSTYQIVPLESYNEMMNNQREREEQRRILAKFQNKWPPVRQPIPHRQRCYLPMQTRMPYQRPVVLPSPNLMYNPLHLLYRQPLTKYYRYAVFNHVPKNPWIPRPPTPIVVDQADMRRFPEVNTIRAHQANTKSTARPPHLPRNMFPAENYVQAHQSGHRVSSKNQDWNAYVNGKQPSPKQNTEPNYY